MLSEEIQEEICNLVRYYEMLSEEIQEEIYNLVRYYEMLSYGRDL